MTILVFPSCLEASARFADETRRRHQRVIGASSLSVDPYAARYHSWEKLPFISDSGFFSALKALVDREQVDSIYSPHMLTFSVLEAELPSRLPHVSMIGDRPWQMQMTEVQQALQQAERDLRTIRDFGLGAFMLPVQFLAGLSLQMERFFGQCSKEKALALCALMPSAVKGDVVEIGSLFGKSAYLLNRLAYHFDVGATLAVDPWNLGLAIQHDAPVALQNTSHEWNWDLVHQGFLLNMLGSVCPPFNYVRTSSADAYEHYSLMSEVSTPEFGTTSFARSISILHIDGNHDEAAVAEDFALWSRRLAPGAWIVFDDYNWLYGDGPRRVADRALGEYGARMQRCFFAGGALFANVE